MPDNEVRIKVVQTEEGRGALNRVAEDLKKVTSEAGSAGSGLAGFGRRLLQVAGSIPGVSSGLLAIGSATAAISTAFLVARRAIDEFAQGEAGVAKLEAALANFGHSSQASLDELQDLASQLQKTTGIADDEWYATLVKLIQAGSNPKSIGMDVEVVKNLGGAIGDLGTATTLYARALQGNFEGFSRYGIIVREAGTQTEKLKDIQEQAAQKGAGILEANTQTLTGQFRALGNATADAFEATGQWLAKTGFIQSLLLGATEATAAFASAVGENYRGLGLLNQQASGTASSLGRYRDEANRILEVTRQTVTAMDDEVAALRRKQAAMDRLSEARAEYAKAGIDLDVSTGTISPQEGIRRRARVDVSLAREKAGREEETSTAELRNRMQQVQLLEGQKKAIDRDLAKERNALQSDQKRQSITALLASLQSSRGDEARASAAAAWDPTVTPTPVEYRAWSADEEGRQAQMGAFTASTLRRISNRSSLHRGRISELERMKAEIEPNLIKARGLLTSEAPEIRSRVVAGQIDLGTAELRARSQMATAGGAETSSSLRRSADSTAGAAATLENYTARLESITSNALRRLDVLERQAKNQSNR